MVVEASKNARKAALNHWAKASLKDLGFQPIADMVSISDDASFRRYFRMPHGSDSAICVDAPPDKEDNESFIKVQSMLLGGGVAVPEIIAKDVAQGFLVLSDFGDELFLSRLSGSDHLGQVSLYQRALTTLEAVSAVPAAGLPLYDGEKLRAEMQLFPDWFLAEQLKMPVDEGVSKMLNTVMKLMVENAGEQPSVFVHRDYHARNLMMLDKGDLGVIDFQDAVVGPVTYDLVSLLKDCYWRLPRETVVELVESHRQKVVGDVDEGQFLRWFDLMGFQRHLKCAGIFCRLNLRDGKAGYLKDIPLVISYLVEVSDLYPELHNFGAWLKQEIEPRLQHLS